MNQLYMMPAPRPVGPGAPVPEPPDEAQRHHALRKAGRLWRCRLRGLNLMQVLEAGSQDEAKALFVAWAKQEGYDLAALGQVGGIRCDRLPA